MYIKGILKNSQDRLADLVHPQQDGTFEQVEVIETSSKEWKSSTLAIVLHLRLWSLLVTLQSLRFFRPLLSLD